MERLQPQNGIVTIVIILRIKFREKISKFLKRRVSLESL